MNKPSITNVGCDMDVGASYVSKLPVWHILWFVDVCVLPAGLIVPCKMPIHGGQSITLKIL